MTNMLGRSFRPWGLLPWVLHGLSVNRWAFVGAVSPEDRCHAAWSDLRSMKGADQHFFFQISDLPVGSWAAESEERLARSREFANTAHVSDSCIVARRIDAKHAEIIEPIRAFIASGVRDIIIDCSSLPKRFFFPIVKELILTEGTQIPNIIAVYTRPAGYASGSLAIDPQPWHPLPRFMPPVPKPRDALYVVGLGYDPLGLPQLLADQEIGPDSIKLLFPFPADPPGYRRNWEFVRQLEPNLGESFHEPIRVNGYDVAEVYERITSLADEGRRYVVFAPYGPKPMSLAMCIYASMHDNTSAVYYTQPKAYNPSYSYGVKEVCGQRQVYAYCLRLGGRNLY